MHTIILLEDHVMLGQLLMSRLEQEGWIARWVTSIKEAYECLESYHPDLCILDRVLPDGDGLEIAEFVRDFSDSTKVLVLSQQGESSDRIAGLRQGADAYLSKPCSHQEILLQCQKLLAVHKQPTYEELWAQGAKFSPEQGVLSVADKSIALRKRESQILTCLLRRKNGVVSRDTLIRSVWRTAEAPMEGTIDAYVRRLRMSVKDAVKIDTVRGFGYRVKDKA